MDEHCCAAIKKCACNTAQFDLFVTLSSTLTSFCAVGLVLIKFLIGFQAPPKRIRSPGLSVQTTGQSLALRPNSVILLLRVAYKDMSLNFLCRKVYACPT
jgi:hypothetical protein